MVTKKCIVAGCMAINEGRMLMLKHRKLGMWVPPGGHVEENEFPYEAAIRETKEETGIDVELVGDDNVRHIDEAARSLPMPFAILYENVPYRTQPMHLHFDMIYVGKAVGGTIVANNESTDIKWMNAKEIGNMETLPNVKDVALKALARYKNL
ncbi:MAG: NUDIX domain-containing protein [Candidatus Micrarchaeaceae archaeon]